MGLFSFLNKNKKENNSTAIHTIESSAVVNARNWYMDRYESIVVQRNMLFLLSIVALILVLVTTFFVSKVVMTKTVEPMVIEIEEKSGITNIVNPLENQEWTESKAVNEYFIIKYLRARETYNIANYLYNYNQVTRILSSASIYNDFKKTINNPEKSPVAKYGSNNSTTLQIRYIQFLNDTSNGKNVQIQFTVTEQSGSKKTYNKIVSMIWKYVDMSLNFEDRMINPLGFQVVAYSVAEERNVS